MDFGSDPNNFNGKARWLQIAVRPGQSGDPNYISLSPRQPINPTPYAIGSDWNNLANMPAGFADGVDDTGGSVSAPLYLYDLSPTPFSVISGNNSGTGYGVYGQNNSTENHGILGTSSTGVTGSSISGSGVYGISNFGYAGHFAGNVFVEGAYYDSSQNPGTVGQILSSTASP